MPDKLVGAAVRGSTIAEVQANIARAEELGVHAAWMTTGGASLDSLTCFAAASAATNSIKLGTSIIPTYPVCRMLFKICMYSLRWAKGLLKSIPIDSIICR